MKEEWERKKLHEKAEIIMGQSPPSKFYNETGEGVPFFQGVTEFQEIHPKVKKFTTKITKSANKNDILMSVRAPVGDLNISDVDCCIGRGLCAIRPNRKNRFIYYLLKENNSKIRSYSGGTTYESINRDHVKNLEFNFPTNSEDEDKISTILSNYDNLIENNTKRIQLLEKIAKLIYDEWFVKFKFPGHEKVKMVDSELGKIPEGWEIKKLEEIGKFKNGVNYLRGDIGDTVFSIVNVRDISNKRYIPTNTLDRINFNFDKAEDYLLKSKDIIIARSACPGEVSILIDEIDNLIFSGFSIRFRLVHPEEYLYVFLSLQKLKQKLMNFSTGTAMKSVNQDTLKRMKILVPKRDVMNEFLEIIEPTFVLLSNLLLRNENLHKKRNLLLPKLIGGQIDISNLDIKIPEVEI